MDIYRLPLKKPIAEIPCLVAVEPSASSDWQRHFDMTSWRELNASEISPLLVLLGVISTGQFESLQSGRGYGPLQIPESKRHAHSSNGKSDVRYPPKKPHRGVHTRASQPLPELGSSIQDSILSPIHHSASVASIVGGSC